MAAADEQLPLDYKGQWIVLGIVTIADKHSDQKECSEGDDPNPEHYRFKYL